MDYNFKLSNDNFSVSNSFHSINFSIFCKAAFLSEGAIWNIPRKPQSENWGAGVGEQLSDRDMVREGEEGHRKKTRLTDQGPKTVEKTALRECFLNRIIQQESLNHFKTQIPKGHFSKTVSVSPRLYCQLKTTDKRDELQTCFTKRMIN